MWWHEPPDEKPRPVLILTREEAIPRLLDVVVMPATGMSRHWLTEVEVGTEDGMPATSFLVAENTLSAEKAHLTERITMLGAAKVSKVCRALGQATGCG
jgi:mRNA interferase MazF